MDRVDQRGFDNQRSEYVSAKEAARFLGIKLETLYAYASRGLVRSEPGPRGRGRRYARGDLERLKLRGEARSGHGPVAAGALRWGEPVLKTAISAIRADGPAYRGHSAVELARGDASFEAVADLLITGSFSDGAGFREPDARTLLKRMRLGLPPKTPPIHALLATVPRLGLLDEDRFGAPKEAEFTRARRHIALMTVALGHAGGDDPMARAARADGIADSLAVALGASPRRARDAFRRTLILLADHELNASTFATRVVASTGADLYACVTGGLAALTGPRHGAFSDRVEALLDEAGDPSRASDVIHARASRGESLPGFGHPLYPDGDPRVAPLFEIADALAPNDKRVKTLHAFVEEMARMKRDPPNVDFGLVAIVRALDLPRGSATALFAIGRTAGWIAHALEQREAAHLLRPRAEYVGP